MNDVDPRQFFDRYSRFFDTDELGSVADRLNARYFALVHRNQALLEGATVLDLASHDGRFSFAALQAGAKRVIGIEHGAALVQKAIENMHYYGVPADRYEFVPGDIFDLIDKADACYGPFDVVFCFGIFYHIMAHMALLTKIADLEPRTLIIDTNVSQFETPVIELRGPVNGRELRLGETVEGYPSRSALDAMLSSFGWTYDYLDWGGSALADLPQMLDYQQDKRVSVIVDCHRQLSISAAERDLAVRLVLSKVDDQKYRWRRIEGVASRFGISKQTLDVWVRKAQRTGTANRSDDTDG